MVRFKDVVVSVDVAIIVIDDTVVSGSLRCLMLWISSYVSFGEERSFFTPIY